MDIPPKAILKAVALSDDTGIAGSVRLIVVVNSLYLTLESSTNALWVASGKSKKPSSSQN